LEIIKEFREHRKKVLCVIVLDKVASWPFKRLNSKIKQIYALFIIFISLEAIQLIALIITQKDMPPVFPTTLRTIFR
jgi:hypothetical protein